MSFYDDKIEAYLTGKLNESEKASFESEVAKDSNLKSEVDLQNDLIEAIRNTRKIQLKARLNAIEVGSTVSSGVSSTIKIAASVITVGIIGAGIYYMSVVSNKEKQTNQSAIVVDSKNISEGGSELKVANVEAKEKSVSSTEKTRQNRETSDSKASKEIFAKNDITAVAKVPDGDISDIESDKMYKDKSVELPDGGIVELGDRKTLSLDPVIDDKDKSDFSYKYYSNKLFLYGDFQDQPYNLVEINTPKMKQLYLFYEGKYYELKSNQTKATRLKEVKDSSVLEQLSNKK